MVTTRIAESPRRQVLVQTQIKKAQSKKQKLKIKFVLNPEKLVFPLLTTLLWLVFVPASTAQQSLAKTSEVKRSRGVEEQRSRGAKGQRGKGEFYLPYTITSSSHPEHSPSPNHLITLNVPSQLLFSGNQISLNGRILTASWGQWQMGTNKEKVHTAISDAGVSQLLGVELLNTNNPAKQPVRWFSQSPTTPTVLASWLRGAYRYLDITELATRADWQLSIDGSTLRITTPTAKVKEIRQGKQPWGDRIVVDLDRPTFWQVTQQPPLPKPKLQLPNLFSKPKPKPPNQEWLITINAAANPVLSQRFNSTLAEPRLKAAESSPSPVVKLESAANLTTIRLSVPAGLYPRISTLANPNRLIIDLRPDAMVERDILWSPGLRWRQQFIDLGDSHFPVVWLEVNPQAVGLSLKPIWSEATSLVGIAPISATAQRYTAVAAINGGFFNRNNKYPLGAIRRDGKWLSSPILNRGAIAWNEQGQVKINRLKLQETLLTSTGQRLPILTRNSGYIQSGIAFYSPVWGATYTPATDNEIIVAVQNNQVTAQIPGGAAARKATIPIPHNGYLLAVRGDNAAASLLPIGTLLRLENATQPADFALYSQILGAGPLLIQNRQIVLDAKAEGFSDAFIREKAARSAICTTKTGNILIAAVHNRAGGNGPTLMETAKLMQYIGCVDALNLDGGSSASLYLGGQLLNRSPRTAARVHNGLGIFLQPSP